MSIYSSLMIFLESIKQKINIHKLNLNGNKIHKKATVYRNNTFEGENKIGGGSVVVASNFGYGTYIGENCSVWFSKIGRYTSIGNDVKIIAGRHPINKFVSTHPNFYSLSHNQEMETSYIKEQKFDEYNFADKENERLVIIGNDCWIGTGAKILEGIKIGDGAVIAAGAVVTKDVLPYSINAGVPSRVIKYRFEPEIIKKLETIKWWDKPIDWILSHANEFDDVDLFIKSREDDLLK